MQKTSLKPSKPSLWELIAAAMRWTRASYTLMSAFIALLFLIGYVWWPLIDEYLGTINPKIPLWRQIDLLLLGNFAVMSLLIMANADIKADLPIVVIGLFGGLVIESWGTQTELWTYYTNERPPLWIIPAWPIASLSIDRLYRLLKLALRNLPEKLISGMYWLALPAFFVLMLSFTWPTVDKSLTLVALIFCAFLILTPTNPRGAILTFIAGTGLGYFLELWGTTRLTWVYYTQETPPLFAVLAHGMAALAFWRVLGLYKIFAERFAKRKSVSQ